MFNFGIANGAKVGLMLKLVKFHLGITVGLINCNLPYRVMHKNALTLERLPFPQVLLKNHISTEFNIKICFWSSGGDK